MRTPLSRFKLVGGIALGLGLKTPRWQHSFCAAFCRENLGVDTEEPGLIVPTEIPSTDPVVSTEEPSAVDGLIALLPRIKTVLWRLGYTRIPGS